MTICRLVREKYTRVAYDGGGALASGGRWHRAGTRVAYASEHAALAVLEKLVWTGNDSVLVEVPFALVPLTLRPERHLEHLADEELPPAWDSADHTAGTREVGMEWLIGESMPALSVPSVLLPAARNFLVNPLAPGFEDLIVGDAVPFTWDPRLFDRPAF